MRKLILLIGFGAVATLAACSGGGGSDDSDGGFDNGGATLERRIIEDYTNDFIISTYAALDGAAATLDQTAQALAANTTDANLVAARNAWVAARIPWEKSETSLFGPVDFFGFDPALDSWPVNRADLDAVLASGAPLNQATIRNLDNTLKGFHTIEYILWGETSVKSASQITAREKEYLLGLTSELRSVTSQLLAAWTTGVNGQGPYAQELLLAGQGSTTFVSEATALEQMVRGMMVICDEVANGKIAEPFDTRNPNIVESQFSFNSIADFANNIRGAKEAYEVGPSRLITTENPALNARVLAEFDAAITAVTQIPEPFRNAILDSSNDPTIIAAQQAIRRVNDTLAGPVLQQVLS